MSYSKSHDTAGTTSQFDPVARQRQAQMKRERERMRARRDRRVTYDLPPELRQHMQNLAQAQHVPASQLAALAIYRFLEDWEKGEIDLARYQTPSLSPRYDWNLELPKRGNPRQ